MRSALTSLLIDIGTAGTTQDGFLHGVSQWLPESAAAETFRKLLADSIAIGPVLLLVHAAAAEVKLLQRPKWKLATQDFLRLNENTPVDGKVPSVVLLDTQYL
jgi:hypothetical protein